MLFHTSYSLYYCFSLLPSLSYWLLFALPFPALLFFTATFVLHPLYWAAIEIGVCWWLVREKTCSKGTGLEQNFHVELCGRVYLCVCRQKRPGLLWIGRIQNNMDKNLDNKNTIITTSTHFLMPCREYWTLALTADSCQQWFAGMCCISIHIFILLLLHSIDWCCLGCWLIFCWVKIAPLAEDIIVLACWCLCCQNDGLNCKQEKRTCGK